MNVGFEPMLLGYSHGSPHSQRIRRNCLDWCLRGWEGGIRGKKAVYKEFVVPR